MIKWPIRVVYVNTVKPSVACMIGSMSLPVWVEIRKGPQSLVDKRTKTKPKVWSDCFNPISYQKHVAIEW